VHPHPHTCRGKHHLRPQPRQNIVGRAGAIGKLEKRCKDARRSDQESRDRRYDDEADGRQDREKDHGERRLSLDSEREGMNVFIL